jgi:hypothetical protein
VLRCARRAGAWSSAMVALMVASARGFASVYHSGDELARSGRGDFEECAQGAISILCQESAFAVIGTQGPVFSLLCFVLVSCCFGGSGL